MIESIGVERLQPQTAAVVRAQPRSGGNASSVSSAYTASGISTLPSVMSPC